MNESKSTPKLIIRLSSLGDIILLSAFLNQEKDSTVYDVLTLEIYKSLFIGHPRVRHIWTYQKKTGLKGWLQLLRTVLSNQYSEILDMHGSMRTRCAYFYDRFFFHSQSKWIFIKKHKLKRNLFFILKKKLPPQFRPHSWWKLFGEFNKKRVGTPILPPQLTHLLNTPLTDSVEVNHLKTILTFHKKKLFAVMPSTRWEGKKWPLIYYLKVIQNLDGHPIILGTLEDQESRKLIDLLNKNATPHISLVGNFSFPFLAQVLKNCHFILGNDTGLLHLAEAVGSPSFMIFGPTHPDSGFAPWKTQSLSLHSGLWCSPCGKDGRYCFRQGKNKYLCMQKLTPEKVIQSIQNKLIENQRSEK